MGPDTRTRLILSAMELFWEKGYASTSMADVLRRADVHGGSLYHFFPGKQDLLLAVLDFYITGIHQQLLEPAWKGVDDPIERVWALLALYRSHIIATDCFYGCPIGSLALEIHEPDPPVRERLAANFENWTVAVQQCLDAAQWPAPARRIRAHHHGRRRDAHPHLPRRRLFRPGDRGAACLCGPAAVARATATLGAVRLTGSATKVLAQAPRAESQAGAELISPSHNDKRGERK
jgi:TetR/AcrR family transcriptional repressor of nem operon